MTQQTPQGNPPKKNQNLPLTVSVIAAVVLFVVIVLAGIAIIRNLLGSRGESTGNLTIVKPADGEVVDIANPFTSGGLGSGLPDGEVVVQALDMDGTVLDEQSAMLSGDQVTTGGEGYWIAPLSVNVMPGTPGKIRVYAPSEQDDDVLAEALISVTFGAPAKGAAYLTITEPINYAALDINNPVIVKGQGAGLPEGNLVVQALDAEGNVLTQQDTTIQSPDAGTGGEGPWSAELSFEAQPGTGGMIRAFSISPADGSTLAQASIDVTYITDPTKLPYLTIAEPAENASLDTTKSITVRGMAGRLPEGTVNVQALDANGNILTQDTTTIQSPDAGTGGEGPWSVELSFAAEPGSSGKLRAFSTSLKDGSVIAEDTVVVSYIKPPPEQPYLTISEPASGAILEISAAVTVKGLGRGMPEGNLVVQALDSNGKVLAQQPTTIQAPDASTGAEGPWSVQLQIAAQPGTPGQIRAYSESPADGSTIAQASISVTFGKTPEVQPYLTITTPSNGAVLDISKPVDISGMGRGMPEGNLVVQALDPTGNVLTQQASSIQAPDAGTGGEGPWSTNLTINVTPGTTGTVRAFAVDPADGSTIADARIDVTFGSSQIVPPYITISVPTNGAILPVDQAFDVSGTAGNLFEGNLVIQALDADGNILDQQSTIIQSQQAGTGGEGPWSVQLSVSIQSGSTGRIYAFATSPADGSTVASDSVQVIYGEAGPPPELVVLEDHLWVLSTYGGNSVLNETQVTAAFKDGQVSGFAGCNTYSGSYERTTTELTIAALNSTQQNCENPTGIMDQENEYLALLVSAATFSIQDQQLNIFNQSGLMVLVFQSAVVGTIVPEGEGTLVEGSTARITLADVSRTDSAAAVIAEQTITNPAAFPVAFKVAYDPERIEPRNAYAIDVRITDPAGNLIYANTDVYYVITQGYPSEVDIMVTAE